VPRQQSGVVLLAVMVFLLIASLLALGDARSLQTQQSMVASRYEHLRALAYTEGALLQVESETLSKAMNNNSFFPMGPDGNGTSTNSVCTSNRDSDTALCRSDCSGLSNLYSDRTNKSVRGCRWCSQPSPGCMARWDETPWASRIIYFNYDLTNAVAIRAFSFQTVSEYLGAVPCTPGSGLRDCKAYRITVGNMPATNLQASVKLQSTYVYDPTDGTGQRVSWREILPD
jgi:Tfp pilus assembly protein PilX